MSEVSQLPKLNGVCDPSHYPAWDNNVSEQLNDIIMWLKNPEKYDATALIYVPVPDPSVSIFVL